jgi:hypothetical protein
VAGDQSDPGRAHKEDNNPGDEGDDSFVNGLELNDSFKLDWDKL